MVSLNKQQLIKFEKKIFDEFEKGNIKGAVHLSGSVDGYQEDWLINYFKNNVKKNDWIAGTHRTHYHALLKSNNLKWVRKVIMDGHSLHINSKKYKIITSGIVGGNIPIALGLALSIKLKNKKEHVHCFIGDMASQMGCFNEAINYAHGHDLPKTFIIENNGLGVYTPTSKIWGTKDIIKLIVSLKKVISYSYKRKYPHHGTGSFIHF